MTQAIVCRNREGLVLATDSCALRELENGRVERLTERKLFALSRYAAVLAVDAQLGVDLAEELQAWLRPRNLADMTDVLAVSQDFLAEGYARYQHAARGRPPGDRTVLRHLYFIIGGYSPAGVSSGPQAILLDSEAGELPFKETQLGSVFALPRRLVFEGRVTRQIAEGISLRRLAEISRAELQNAAERNPEAVGGPFHVAMVTAAGLEFLEDAG